MIDAQIDIAIEAERDIDNMLKTSDSVYTLQHRKIRDYIERQISFDLYIYDYFKKTTNKKRAIKLLLLRSLLDKNLMSFSIIRKNKKVLEKTIN